MVDGFISNKNTVGVKDMLLSINSQVDVHHSTKNAVGLYKKLLLNCFVILLSVNYLIALHIIV